MNLTWRSFSDETQAQHSKFETIQNILAEVQSIKKAISAKVSFKLGGIAVTLVVFALRVLTRLCFKGVNRSCNRLRKIDGVFSNKKSKTNKKILPDCGEVC